MTRGTVLVGGPIQHALDGRDGRIAATVRAALEAVIRTIKEAGLLVVSAHEAERYGELDMSHLADVVAVRDFQWMCDALAYVCLMPPDQTGTIRSDGSCVELGWATARGIPALILHDAATDPTTMSAIVRGLPAISRVQFATYSSVPDMRSCIVEFCRELEHELGDR